MNVNEILKSQAFKKVAATFAAGYAKRIMEGQYTRLMNTKIGKHASRLGRPSRYAVEAVLSGIVAWASTKATHFANTPVREFLWELAKDAPSEISKRLLKEEHAETIDIQVSGEDARPVLDGLLNMDAKDLNALVAWLQNASPEERQQLTEAIAKQTDEQQRKLMTLTPGGARALSATSEPEQTPKRKQRPVDVQADLDAAHKRLDQELRNRQEKRKGAP